MTRMTACPDGDLAVLLIGMRVFHWHKPHRWLPPMIAMQRLVTHLQTAPETGFLGAEILGFGLLVQYWRSLDALNAYAHDASHDHPTAWRDLQRHMAKAPSAVGFWHEAYHVTADAMQSVYLHIPPYALARAVGRRAV